MAYYWSHQPCPQLQAKLPWKNSFLEAMSKSSQQRCPKHLTDCKVDQTYVGQETCWRAQGTTRLGSLWCIGSLRFCLTPLRKDLQHHIGVSVLMHQHERIVSHKVCLLILSDSSCFQVGHLIEQHELHEKVGTWPRQPRPDAMCLCRLCHQCLIVGGRVV